MLLVGFYYIGIKPHRLSPYPPKRKGKKENEDK